MIVRRRRALRIELRYPAARGEGPYAPTNNDKNAPSAELRRRGVDTALGFVKRIARGDLPVKRLRLDRWPRPNARRAGQSPAVACIRSVCRRDESLKSGKCGRPILYGNERIVNTFVIPSRTCCHPEPQARDLLLRPTRRFTGNPRHRNQLERRRARVDPPRLANPCELR
jgi:hypothetical protein